MNSKTLSSLAFLSFLVSGAASAATQIYWTEATGFNLSTTQGVVRRMDLDSPGTVTDVFRTPLRSQFSGLDSTDEGIVVGGVFGFDVTALSADPRTFHFESRATYDATRLAGLTYYTTGSSTNLYSAPDEFTGETLVLDNDRFTHAIEAYGGRIYFGENGSASGGAINRMEADGSGLVQLIDGARTYDIEVFGGYLYYAINDFPTNAIVRANLDGTGVTTVINNSGYANALEVTADGIFWTEFNAPGAGTLKRANLDGTGTTTLLSGLSSVRGLAVVEPAAIPEPASSSALAGLGLLGVVVFRRRSRS